MSRKSLYKKLIESGREEKCEICGISVWQNQPITLQIHHKDGNPKNNDFSNLQILCPNCHSQTDNYCSKNRKKIKEKFYCSQCGKELYERTISGLCKDCWNKFQIQNSKCPSKDELLSKCYELKSYSKISKFYNVSDKTVRKWCSKYDIDLKNLNIKPDITPSEKSKQCIIDKYGKPICQFNSDGTFVAEFSSIGEAERQTGIPKSNIRCVINGKRLTAGGFVWKFK